MGKGLFYLFVYFCFVWHFILLKTKGCKTKVGNLACAKVKIFFLICIRRKYIELLRNEYDSVKKPTLQLRNKIFLVNALKS